MYSVDHVGRLPWRRHFSFGPRHFQGSTAHFLFKIHICMLASFAYLRWEAALFVSVTLAGAAGEQLQLQCGGASAV
jgi:hypothetical protein